jgi:hypothetical protein
MESNGENNSTLAKRSGIPYTTIDGLFKRGWEKAQISTIQKICDFYNVSLDYMIYGADKLSEEAQMIAAKYDNLDAAGKETAEAVINLQMNRMESYGRCETLHKAKRIPIFDTAEDSVVFAKYHAKREVEEIVEERESIAHTCEK